MYSCLEESATRTCTSFLVAQPLWEPRPRGTSREVQREKRNGFRVSPESSPSDVGQGDTHQSLLGRAQKRGGGGFRCWRCRDQSLASEISLGVAWSEGRRGTGAGIYCSGLSPSHSPPGRDP